MSIGGDDINMELTDAEQGELDTAAADAAEPTADTETAPDQPAEPQEVERRDDATGTAALTEAAAALKAAADAMRQTAPSEQAQAAETPAEPDWTAERAALRSRYEAGELDDDEYESAREALLERKALHNAEQAVAARMQQEREDAANRAWSDAMSRFAADASNQSLLNDVARSAAFNAVLQAVANEAPRATYDEWLATAKERTLAAFGIQPATDTQNADAIRSAQDARRARAGQTPPDLSRAPAAGSPGGGSALDTLDELDIDSLEDRLARMTAEDAERYLASAPGGLRDHPRA